MSGVSKTILIGHLGRDPEVRTFPSGGKIVTMNVATSETWRDKQTGERKERTEWHKVVIYDERLCKTAEDYLKKGSTVYIVGQNETRSWEKNGEKRYATEVAVRSFKGELTLLDRRKGSGDPGPGEDDMDRRGGDDPGPRYNHNDDIPF